MRADTSAPDVRALVARLPDDERACGQALRFLGYRDESLADAAAHERVRHALCQLSLLARPALVRRSFEVTSLPLELPGESVREHLSGAIEVVLFCVTLGAAVDRELRVLGATDAPAQVIFDAAASAAIERLADAVEATVRAEAAERGLFCSWRFSPGYGDLPLSVQPRLLAVLDATRRIGVSPTASNLMVPTKSVSALVGIHPTPQPGLAESCAVCELADLCALRRRGLTCGR